MANKKTSSNSDLKRQIRELKKEIEKATNKNSNSFKKAEDKSKLFATANNLLLVKKDYINPKTFTSLNKSLKNGSVIRYTLIPKQYSCHYLILSLIYCLFSNY